MIVLRDYQRSAVAALLKNSRGVVQAPAGSGKTIIGAEAVHQWTRRTGQAIRRPLGAGFGFRGGGRSLGHHRVRPQFTDLPGIVLVKEHGLENRAHVPFHVVGQQAQQNRTGISVLIYSCPFVKFVVQETFALAFRRAFQNSKAMGRIETMMIPRITIFIFC